MAVFGCLGVFISLLGACSYLGVDTPTADLWFLLFWPPSRHLFVRLRVWICLPLFLFISGLDDSSSREIMWCLSSGWLVSLIGQSLEEQFAALCMWELRWTFEGEGCVVAGCCLGIQWEVCPGCAQVVGGCSEAASAVLAVSVGTGPCSHRAPSWMKGNCFFHIPTPNP